MDGSHSNSYVLKICTLEFTKSPPCTFLKARKTLINSAQFTQFDLSWIDSAKNSRLELWLDLVALLSTFTLNLVFPRLY